MVSNSYLVLITGIFNICVIRFLEKKIRLPLLLVSFWWSFWLFISTLSLTGLFTPSEHSIFLFIIAISSNTLGGAIYSIVRNKKRISIDKTNLYWKQPASRVINVCYLIAFLLFPIILFVFYRSIVFYAVIDSSNLAEFRSLAFSELRIFPYAILDLIYYLFLSPMLMTLFIFGLSNFLLYDSKSLFLLSSTLLIIDNLSKAGRFSAYTIVLMTLLVFYYKYFHYNQKSLTNKLIFAFKKNIKILIVIFLSTVLIVQISFGRASYKSTAEFLEEFYNSYIIEYNTIGFVFFDYYLTDRYSTLNVDRFYGRATLGSLERILIKVLELISSDGNDRNIEIDSKSVEVLQKTSLAVNLGKNKNKVFNGFLTIFYSIYQDFSFLGFFILPLIYGFFLTMFSYRFFKVPSLINSSYLLILIYLGLFGIYMPILSGWFWVSLLGIPVINYLSYTKLSKIKFNIVLSGKRS